MIEIIRICKYSSLCSLLLYSVSSFAQSNSISGSVLSGDDGEPLIGATVSIISTGQGVTTDHEGRYQMTNISASEVKMIASYLGFENDTLDVAFGEKKDLSIDFRLESGAILLSQIEVGGKAEGVMKAFIDQKKAENIKNIIAAEQIATFPDMNAAEVLQRIPGITLQRDQGDGKYVQLRGTPPELTNFNVNGEQIPSPEGDVRYVGMDVIPADQIEFVEVTKVLTPDMDADGIGGSVNIKTKEAEGDKPDIRATIAGGYNNLRETPSYQLQFSYGQRYGKFGFNLNTSFFENNQGTDNVEYRFGKGPFFGSQDAGRDNFFVHYKEVQFRHYDIQRTRIGISPTIDYRFNKNSFVYIRGMFDQFTDDERRHRLIYTLDDPLSESYYLFGGVEHDVKDRIKSQDLATLSIGGEHKIGEATIDYQLFYASAKENQPNRLEATFDNPGQAIAINFDFADPSYPRTSFPNPSNAKNVTRYDAYSLDVFLLEKYKTSDQNLTPRLNIKIPLGLTSNATGYFKFGGKFRYKIKERDITSQEYGAYFEESKIYPGVGPPLSLNTVDGGFRDDNFLGQGYVLEAMPDAQKLRDFFEFYPQHFIFDRTATKTQSFGEDYNAEERIYAGYGMIRQDFNKLMLLGGFRYEKTDIDYTGHKILTNKARFVGIDTLTDQRSHSFFLPQVQAKYSINENFNLRAALTYSYSRPNFEDVLPYREEDRDEVQFGNPDLRYPQSTNVDFLIEKYLDRGILSGGVFYKEIDDFIFFFKRFAHEGDPQDYSLVEITKAVNGNKATVYGAELQAQFKLSFLNGFWRNFGVFTNYTYTYSEAFINERFPANYSDAVVIFGDDDLGDFSTPDSQEKITLPGQAEHTFNGALFYDSNKFFIKATANFQDDFLFRLGADADLDEFYDQSFRLDLNANVFLTDNLKFFVDVLNVTNEPLRFYLGTKDRIKQNEFYSWSSRFGIKLQF